MSDLEGGEDQGGDDFVDPEHRRLVNMLKPILRAGAVLALITFVLVFVLQIQIGRRNSSITKIEKSVERLEVVVEDLSVAVDETRDIAQSFVQDPEEQAAQQEQLQRLFIQIGEIHAAIVGGE